jgi:adenosylhomocysteine nucleosidase
MLGIVVALPWELTSLTHASVTTGTCKAISDDVMVALSGIGAERAQRAAGLLVSQGATALLSWGFAAALDECLTPGTVMIPKRVISATGDTYRVSADWHRRLHQRLSAKLPVSTEALLESETIVNIPGLKRKLARQTRTAASDMESAAQARLARARGLPFVAVRVISDTAATRIPQSVIQALDPSGAVNIPSCLARAFLRPRDGIAMMKLGIQFAAARRTLGRASALVLEASRIYLHSSSTRPIPAARL